MNASLFDRHRLAKSESVAELRFEVRERRRIVLEPLLGVLASLSDPLTLVRVPSPGLLDEAVVDTSVQHAARLGDPFTVHDVELRLSERRCEPVLPPPSPCSYAPPTRPPLDLLFPP